MVINYPTQVCCLYQLLLNDSEVDFEYHFISSLNLFINSSKQLVDYHDDILELFKNNNGNIDLTIKECCELLLNNNDDEFIQDIVEDVCRIFQYCGNNIKRLTILKSILLGLNVNYSNDLIEKDYEFAFEVKDSISKLYLMIAMSDNEIGESEISKLCTPLFIRCKKISDLTNIEELMFYQSDFNNNGGFESLSEYIKHLCDIITLSGKINLNKIKNDLLDIIKVNEFKQLEINIYNQIASNLGFDKIS
jgi:hypothetical protein